MSKKAAPVVTFAAVVGSPPTLEWVAIDRLAVDENYQRSIDNVVSKKLISLIARKWDWRLFQPLSVARRDDGSLYVVDGQHRLAAARMRSDLPHLACVIQSYSGRAEEAEAFDGLNRNRKKMGYLDCFRAAVGAGDEAYSKVDALIRGAGLSVAPHSNYTSWTPGQIACIAGVAKAMRLHGETVTSNALVALAEAWPNEVLRYAGSLLGGLYSIYADMPDGFDPDAFIAMLAEGDQRTWYEDSLGIAVRNGWTKPAAMAWSMLAAYRAVVGDRLAA